MGYFFFLFTLLINSFSGYFSDGVPAGVLDLGQADTALEEEDFLRVRHLQKFLFFSGSLLFKKNLI